MNSIKRLGQLVPIGVSKDLPIDPWCPQTCGHIHTSNMTEIEAIELKTSTEAFSTEAEVHENIPSEGLYKF